MSATHFLSANNLALFNSDSLYIRDYDYLFDKIEALEKDQPRQLLYLAAFLKKAKSEKNWEEMVNGYRNYLYYSPVELRFIYADSMVHTAKLSKDNTLIGSAYLSKGILYYGQKMHTQALDNYLIANDYIQRTNDQYLKNKVKYNIAHIKYYLGFYADALVQFEECLKYFKGNADNVRPYLNTLHSIGLCHNRMGNYGLCSDVNKLGTVEGTKLLNTSMEPYFSHSEGVNQYSMSNYVKAIDKIAYSLPFIRENGDFANESVGYFYIGKSYWDLGMQEKAMEFFRKVDRIFIDKNYIRPDLRTNYELIIAYYKSKNNLNAQLLYIERLLKADSILRNNFRYLSGKIHKEYDTKKLLKEKNNIEQLLQQRKRKDILLVATIIALLILSVFLTYRYFKNKRIYRLKFEELMKKSAKDPDLKAKPTDKAVLDINPDAVSSLLSQLEKFELNKKYLEKDWTLGKLAASFNSNNTYLSKIILYYRGKKFVEYLNDLKVDYIIELLKNDRVVRNYTNKALAEEVGFSSTQRFTNAFVSRAGISPTYFIDELRKTNGSTESEQ